MAASALTRLPTAATVTRVASSHTASLALRQRSGRATCRAAGDQRLLLSSGNRKLGSLSCCATRRDVNLALTAAGIAGSALLAIANQVGVARNKAADFAEMVKSKNGENPVIVYSKSWCPYCGQIKGLFNKLGVEYKVIELDQLVEERAVQDALYDLTGQTTVPNIFIGGKHIGGCDATLALNRSGELVKLFTEAGAPVKAP